MASQPIPDPPATPNGDAWVEVSRGEDGVRYCSEDGSATIRLELVSDGGRKRWEWTNHNVYVGLNLWELQADWERERADVSFEPLPEPKSAPVSLPVPEEYRGRAAPEPEPVDEPKPRGFVQSIRKLVESKPAGTATESPTRASTSSRPVDPAVDHAARVIATAVRERLVMSRAELYQGRNPDQVDTYIAHAVDRGWVVAGPELITPGRVDHRPVTEIGDVDGPAWGPSQSIRVPFRG
jgi:hypothetical protein